MTIYSKEELEEFHKQKVKELEDKLEENEKRFVHILPSNDSSTRMPEDKYIAKMIADFKEAQQRKKSGRQHTAYSPEYGFEIY